MTKMILSLLATVTLSQNATAAVNLMKCVRTDAKTLWASFGRVTDTGTQITTHFPTEITVFGADGRLQDRLYPTLSEALKIPVVVSSSTMTMSFMTKSQGGLDVMEKHHVSIYMRDPRDAHSYMGTWATGRAEPLNPVQVFCTIF